jgi:hypothetical protein
VHISHTAEHIYDDYRRLADVDQSGEHIDFFADDGHLRCLHNLDDD